MNDALVALEQEFAALYAPIGRPSIPPEKLLRAMLLQAFYSIRSERQLMERLEFDLLFRWFVGIGQQPPSLTVSEFLTSTLSRDCRDAARAARQHCHESSAQSPPNGGNRIRNVPFRPQWRTPSGGKLREL